MYAEHPVTGLLLDENNPRFGEPASSQREALNKLLTAAPQKLLRLAEDIAAESINPTELPVVVEEGGGLVVVEGNRRLAALKLLRKPDHADDPGLAARVQKIAQTGVGPDTVFCYQ